MKLSRCGNVILVDNEFKFLLGVNYWPKKLNVRMWRDWDETAIREDLEVMKAIGIRVVRFFIKNEDFADNSANVFPQTLEKFKKFLDLLNEYGLAGFVTLIVGHMSGKNWRIPWTNFEDMYKASSIEKTMKFVETIVKIFKDHPAIAGWILSNELSLVNRARDRDEALTLLRIFAKTVKSIDKDHVVSSGDIPDSYMQETPNVRTFVDYVGPHLYLYDSDTVRHGYTYGSMLELFSNDGDLPIILEEFGFSTHQFSEESHARFVNEVLYTALAHGASGAFVWCFSDFIHESDPPYEWRPLELAFGIVRKDGSIKPVAEVVKRFSNDIISIERCGLNTKYIRKPIASIVAPFYLFKDYEFVWYRETLSFWRIIQPILITSSMLSSCGIDNTIIYELDLEKAIKSKRILFMPSTVIALTSTWRKLLNYVSTGGNLYVSLVKGFAEFKALHEAATHLWSELMGVENILEAGSIGIKYHGDVVLEFVKDFNLFSKGDKIKISVPIPIYTYRVKPVDAETIAVDTNGYPVLFRSRRGSGYVYTMLIPLELALTFSERIEWNSWIPKLYKAITKDVGINIDYEPSSHEVEVKPFYGESSVIVIAINHGGSRNVTLMSKNVIRSVNKIGGDATLISWNSNEVVINMPQKSAIVIAINH